MAGENIEEKLLSDIVNELITERIITEVKRDSEYIRFEKEQQKIEELYCELELSDEEKKLMQDYLKAMSEESETYGHCAYKTGFWDCLVILKELNLIGKQDDIIRLKKFLQKSHHILREKSALVRQVH